MNTEEIDKIILNLQSKLSLDSIEQVEKFYKLYNKFPEIDVNMDNPFIINSVKHLIIANYYLKSMSYDI
jgi:hypothetical protein